jgi:hypothetical protein
MPTATTRRGCGGGFDGVRAVTHEMEFGTAPQELFVMGAASLNPYSDPFFYYPDETPDAAIISVDQESWCQRRDSNSQTPVSKTGCYSNSHTLALWCTGEDLNLRVPLGETGLQPVRFGRAHAPVQTWRKVDESNAHRSSRRPGFQDQLPAIQQYLPYGGEYGS